MAARRLPGSARRGRLGAVESLAGWVFADMLLVLFLVGVGTAIPHEPPPQPEPPVLEEPAPPPIVGMKTTPYKKTIDVDADALIARNKRAQRQTCAALRKAFSARIDAGDRAAFVIVFGGGTDPHAGGVMAERTFPQLSCASSKLFPKDTVGRSYWDGELSRDRLRVEVFVYATDSTG